jgi:hypothetical protein
VYVAPPPPGAEPYVAPTAVASRYVGCRNVRENTWAVTWTVTLRGGQSWRFQDPSTGDTATYTREMGVFSNPGEPPPSTADFVIDEAYVWDEHNSRPVTLRLPESLRLKAHCTQ